MAIILDIKDDSGSVVTTSQEDRKVIVVNNTPVVLKDTTPESVVVEVLKGQPGDTKVYVGDQPPENPQEGYVWIQTSA